MDDEDDRLFVSSPLTASFFSFLSGGESETIRVIGFLGADKQRMLKIVVPGGLANLKDTWTQLYMSSSS